MAATIGALRVVLGADTAQFTSGLKGASAQLTGFSRSAKVAGAAVGVALGAGIGLAVSFASKIRSAIDEADKMGKMAQSIGVPIEALSRLKYAAELSEVSIESLSGGITKLNKALVEAQQDGGSKAAQAFKALGIAIEDIKSPEDALMKVSDAFASFSDGAGKSTVASQLFGRQLGSQMIPLLNQGSAALKAQGDEAERLGLIYTDEMAKAADQFNDDLFRLGKGSEGLAIKLATQLLPVLQKVVDALTYLSNTDPGQLLKDIEQSFSSASNLPALPSFDQFQSQFGGGGGDGKARQQAADELAASMAAQAAATKNAAEAARELEQVMSEGLATYDATRSPLETYRDQLAELQQQFEATAISSDTLARATKVATAQMAGGYLDAAGQITGALAGAFADNKAFAIANAVVNTAAGITKAFADPKLLFPLDFAVAASIAAAGAAQIATISSASLGSSKRPSVGGGRGGGKGGGGGGGSSSGGEAATPTQDKALFIHFQGEGLLSQEQVRGIIGQINAAVGDGVKLVTVAR